MKLTHLLPIAALTFFPSIARAQEVVVVEEEPYCRSHWWGVGRCWHERYRRPVFTFGGELGIAHLEEGGPFGFNSGTGSATDTGPAWGLRVGVDFMPWIGIEGRYIGSYEPGNSRAANVGYAMSGGEVVVRLALPTPFVRPYIFAGVGGYDFELIGDAGSRSASQLNSSSQMGIPMGVGVELLLSWHVGLAIEGTYRFQLSESFSQNDTIGGADLTTLTGVLRFRL